MVLADEVYGSNREFRDGVAELKLDYSLAVRSNTTVWALERQPLPPKPWRGKGAKPTRMRRDQTHRPITVKELAAELPEKAWREVAWREGSKVTLRSALPPWGSTRLRRRPARRPTAGAVVAHPVAQRDSRAGRLLVGASAREDLKKCLVGISKHRWLISAIMKNSNLNSAWHTMKAATGGDFTTTPHSALRLTAF